MASNEIERISKFDNFLSFGAKQNALRIYFSRYDFLKIYLRKIRMEFFSIFYDFVLDQ